MSSKKSTTFEEVGDDLASVTKLVVIGGLAFVGYEIFTSGVLSDMAKGVKGVADVVDTGIEGANKFFGFDRESPCEKPKWYTWLSIVGAVKNIKDRKLCLEMQEQASDDLAKKDLEEDATEDQGDEDRNEIQTETGTTNQNYLDVGAAIRVEWQNYTRTNDRAYLQKMVDLIGSLTENEKEALKDDPDFGVLYTYIFKEAMRIFTSVGLGMATDRLTEPDTSRNTELPNSSLIMDSVYDFHRENF